MSEENKQKEQDLTLEELFEQLEEIITKMESDSIPLDQAFMMYESGLRKLKQCNDRLDRIEKKMLELSSGNEAVPFQ